jgi:hypothetical protein
MKVFEMNKSPTVFTFRVTFPSVGPSGLNHLVFHPSGSALRARHWLPYRRASGAPACSIRAYGAPVYRRAYGAPVDRRAYGGPLVATCGAAYWFVAAFPCIFSTR